MTYEVITERNLTEGFGTVFVYINDVTGGLFASLLIFGIMIGFTIALMLVQKRQSGQADFPVAFLVGSFVSFISAVLLGLLPGMVNAVTYTIVVVLLVVAFLMVLGNQD